MIQKTGIDEEKIREGDSKEIFKSLILYGQFQGIADKNAFSYLERHSSINEIADFDTLKEGVKDSPCPALKSFSAFRNCDYKKSEHNCRYGREFGCILKELDCRKGSINIMIGSAFLFLKEYYQESMVNFIKEGAKHEDKKFFYTRELLKIRNIGPQTASLFLTDLFNPFFFGYKVKGIDHNDFIVIDTLVHNFFHRTGILKALGREHNYNSEFCHTEEYCKGIILEIAQKVDIRDLLEDDNFQAFEPRLIQLCIWLQCADEGRKCGGGVCNEKGPFCNDCNVELMCDKLMIS